MVHYFNFLILKDKKESFDWFFFLSSSIKRMTFDGITSHWCYQKETYTEEQKTEVYIIKEYVFKNHKIIFYCQITALKTYRQK